VRISPKCLPGRWKPGFALDEHTVSSTYLGVDEFGHEQYETQRTEVGELLYRLKYKQDDDALAPLVRTAVDFIRQHLNPEALVPMPASRPRDRQPVLDLATEIAKHLGIPVIQAITKRGETAELKSVYDYDHRFRILAGALSLTGDPAGIRGKRVLLFDDLWRSGATLNAAADVLVDQAKVACLMVLTITKTRSNR
jgi:predicted amidophosphoribosyltransferase